MTLQLLGINKDSSITEIEYSSSNTNNSYSLYIGFMYYTVNFLELRQLGKDMKMYYYSRTIRYRNFQETSLFTEILVS